MSLDQRNNISEDLIYTIREYCLSIGPEYNQICQEQLSSGSLKVNTKQHESRVWNYLLKYYLLGSDRYLKFTKYIDRIFGIGSSDRIKQCVLVERIREFLGTDFDELLIRRKVSDLSKDDLDYLVCNLQRPDLETSDWYRYLNIAKVDRPTNKSDIVKEYRRYAHFNNYSDRNLCSKFPVSADKLIINDRTFTNLSLSAVKSVKSKSTSSVTQNQLDLCLRLVYLWLHNFYKRRMIIFSLDHFENCSLDSIGIEWTHEDSFYDESIYVKLPKLPHYISYKRDFAYNLLRRQEKDCYLKKLEWGCLRISHLPNHDSLIIDDNYDIPYDCDLAFVAKEHFEIELQKDISNTLFSRLIDLDLTRSQSVDLKNWYSNNTEEVHTVLASCYNHNGYIDFKMLKHELKARGYKFFH